MATDTGEINKVLLEEVFRIYQDAEYQMLKKVAKRVKRGITSEGWNEVKLKDVQMLNEDIGKILKDTSSLTKGHLNKGLIKAYKAGMKGASLDFEKIKPGKIPKTFMKDMIPYHLQRMILESYNMVDRASIQILRNTMDVYREVISSTNTGVLAGYETRLQASQNALNEFANKGITGFVDKSGRKWELASYVEMATRTGNAHAAIQGHIDRQLELGNDLVIVSSHANTCPLCAPWGGKVLSIKGNNPKYASLESAKAAGLFHPNCKHTITAYFPFIDEPEGHEHDKGYNPEMYEATQKQRYNERMIRMWKRREAVALTDEEEFRAHNKVLQWQAIQREHVNEYGLRRKYSREGISNRIGDPNKVKAKIQIPDIKVKEPPKKEENNAMPKIKNKYKYSDITDMDWEEWAIDPETFKDVLEGKIPKVGQMTGTGSKLTEKERNAIIEGAHKIQNVAENTRNKDIKAVFRGESYKSKEEVLKKYKLGEKVELETLTATGTTRDIAKEYAGMGNGGDTQALITIKDAKGIKGVRTAPYGMPSDEIILPKGDNYFVSNIMEGKNGEILITLDKKEPNINIKEPKELKIEEPTKKIITKNRSMREIDDMLDKQTLRYNYDTEDKLKENANIWKSKITKDEEESVKKYTGFMFREMNEHMRGINTGSSRVVELVENCTNALNKAKTEEELIVRRGVSCTGFAGMVGERDLAKKLGDRGNVWMEQNLENLVGRIGSDKGFLSTSPHEKGGFFKDIDLRIEVPKGAKAVYVDEISEFKSEKEIIIQKGYNYLITDVVKRSREKYTVYMKLLLPEE